MKKNLKFYFDKSIKDGFALGAFNFCNMETLKGIAGAARDLKSPIILAVSESAMDYMGEEFLKNLIIAAKKTYAVPLFFHLDHGKTLENCKRAISIGFDSVMIDGSSLDIKENIKITKKVVSFAHKKNVLVEGEIGVLKGIEDDVKSDSHIFTSPDEALLFVEKTGVDSLAIAIGTSHGAYKFAGDANLRFDILKQVQNKLPAFPIVLHGASSVDENIIKVINENGGKIEGAKGIPETMLKKACTNFNVSKINTDTDLRMAMTAGIRTTFVKTPKEFDPRKYLASGEYEIYKVVSHKIKDVFKSANKA